MSEAQKPMSIEVLDTHLEYMRKDIQTVLREMSNMATTDDIKKLSDRMDKFVTTDRFDALEKKVDASSLGSSFDRGLSMITRISAAIAALMAMVGIGVAVVRFFDSIKAVI